MFKTCITLCFAAAILSACSTLNDFYKAPPKNVPQAGIKKLTAGKANTSESRVPTSGIIRVAQIDGKNLYYEKKDFDDLMEAELLERHQFTGVSAGLTEFKIEFVFRSKDGGGYFCEGHQLVEIEEGMLYEPAVQFDEGVFTCWIKKSVTGLVASEPSQGDWQKLELSDFRTIMEEWIQHEPMLVDSETYNSERAQVERGVLESYDKAVNAVIQDEIDRTNSDRNLPN